MSHCRNLPAVASFNIYMNNRNLLKYHSWFGLIAGLFLLLMGISGSILIFHKEIDKQLFKEFTKVQTEGASNIDLGIRTVTTQYPKWDIRLFQFDKGNSLVFDLRKLKERKYIFVHPVSGEIIKEINANTHFTSWLLKLHYSLHAGTTGRIVIFLVGIIFLLSLITGIIIYRNAIIKTLFFQTRIKTRNKRNFYSALHRYVGVWGLLLNLVLVITGIFLAYTVAKAGINGISPPDPAPVTASIVSSLEKIKTEYPEFSPTYIRLPLTQERNITIYGKFISDPFFFSEFYNNFQIDPVSGEILSVHTVQNSSILNRLNAMITPLHYAEFGGLGVKILYSLVGLSGPFLSVTGFFIWWKGRKRKEKNNSGKRIREKKTTSKQQF